MSARIKKLRACGARGLCRARGGAERGAGAKRGGRCGAKIGGGFEERPAAKRRAAPTGVLLAARGVLSATLGEARRRSQGLRLEAQEQLGALTRTARRRAVPVGQTIGSTMPAKLVSMSAEIKWSNVSGARSADGLATVGPGAAGCRSIRTACRREVPARRTTGSRKPAGGAFMSARIKRQAARLCRPTWSSEILVTARPDAARAAKAWHAGPPASVSCARPTRGSGARSGPPPRARPRAEVR